MTLSYIKTRKTFTNVKLKLINAIGGEDER
jgi:hypothetical protein